MTDQPLAATSRYLLPVLYGVVLIFLFYPSYQAMMTWWGNSDYNYCSLVPLIAGYLIWERRQALSLPSVPSPAGMVVAALGIFLYLLGELGGHLFTIHLSSWIILVGLLWLHLGWDKFRAIAFPVFILLAMFPLPSIVNTTLTSGLKLLSSNLGVHILQLSGVSVFQEGNIIDLGFTRMEVVEACSGLRYFFPLILVAVLLAGHQKARFWQRALLVLSAVPFSILTNGLRIAGMGWLYPVMGNKIVEGFWHEFLGWLLFMLTIGFFLVEMRFLLWLVPVKPGTASQAPSPGAYSMTQPVKRQRPVLPLALAMLVMLGATATAVRAVNFREQVPLARPMAEFPMTIGEWQGKTSRMEQKFLDVLSLTDYLQADYVDKQGRSVGVYVGYYASQTMGVSSHSPEVCLPGSGWIFKDSGLVNAPVGTMGATAEVKRVVMEKNGARMLMYYWSLLQNSTMCHSEQKRGIFNGADFIGTVEDFSRWSK